LRTLITGPTGRVGSRYVRRQLDLHRTVRVLVRSEAQVAPWWNGGAEVVSGDLREPETSRRAVEGVDAVVHIAAAFRGVPDDEAYVVNRDATIALAHAALDAGVSRFVFLSTNLVYGPGRGRPSNERDEPQPAGAYPTGKAAAEVELLRLHREHGLPVRVARLAFVYGDGDPHLAESLMWARQWPPHKRLHLVHHADVAQALDRILAAEGVDGQVFNVADDAPVTALDLLRANQEEPDPEAAARPLDDPWAGIVDTCRIRAELGYRPLYPTLFAAQAAGAL
jgi:nucleoside-diphosphate-sugar epimerase